MFRVIGGVVVYAFACYGLLTFLARHVWRKDRER